MSDKNISISVIANTFMRPPQNIMLDWQYKFALLQTDVCSGLDSPKQICQGQTAFHLTVTVNLYCNINSDFSNQFPVCG